MNYIILDVIRTRTDGDLEPHIIANAERDGGATALLILPLDPNAASKAATSMLSPLSC